MPNPDGRVNLVLGASRGVESSVLERLEAHREAEVVLLRGWVLDAALTEARPAEAEVSRGHGAGRLGIHVVPPGVHPLAFFFQLAVAVDPGQGVHLPRPHGRAAVPNGVVVHPALDMADGLDKVMVRHRGSVGVIPASQEGRADIGY